MKNVQDVSEKEIEKKLKQFIDKKLQNEYDSALKFTLLA